MPDAPQYGGPQIRTAPVATPRLDPGIATPDTFGASAVEGAGAAAFAITKEQRDQEESRDQTNAMDARLRYLDARNEDMAAYQQRLRKDAIGLPEQARKDHEKRRDEIAGTLTSPGSKEMFSRMMARQWVSEDATVTSHAAAQVKAYEIGTAESTIAQLREQAIASGNPTDISDALSLTVGTRMKLAGLKGEDAVTTDLHHQADRSAIYGGIVQAKLAEGDFVGASDFYEANKQHLDATTSRVLGEDTRKGRIAVQAQSTADVIMRTMEVDRTKAFAQVASIEDPQLRESTRVNVLRAFADRDAAKAEATGSSYEGLAKQLEGGASLDTLAASNPDAWNALDQEHRDALRHVEHGAITRTSPPVGSDRAYLVRNEAAELPDAFMSRDFRLERGRMAEADRTRLMELQADMRTARTKGKPASTATRGFLTVDGIARGTLRSIGINPDVVKGEVDPRATSFLNSLDKAVEAAGGHEKVTNTQVREIADRLLLEQTVPDKAGRVGTFINTIGLGLPALGPFGIGKDGTKQVRTFELPNADKMAFTPEQVPSAMVKRVTDELTAAGVANPSPEQVMDTYNRALSAQAP